MILADVNANKNKKNQKRSGGCILQIFIKKYLQNLKYNVKKICTFHLVLVGILSILILYVKNRGWEVFA